MGLLRCAGRRLLPSCSAAFEFARVVGLGLPIFCAYFCGGTFFNCHIPMPGLFELSLLPLSTSSHSWQWLLPLHHQGRPRSVGVGNRGRTEDEHLDKRHAEAAEFEVDAETFVQSRSPKAPKAAHQDETSHDLDTSKEIDAEANRYYWSHARSPTRSSRRCCTVSVERQDPPTAALHHGVHVYMYLPVGTKLNLHMPAARPADA